MLNQQLTIKVLNKPYEFNVSRDNPFLLLTNVSGEVERLHEIYGLVSIKIKYYRYSGGDAGVTMPLPRKREWHQDEWNRIIELEEPTRVEISLVNNEGNIVELENSITIHYHAIAPLDTSIPTSSFDAHLADPRNTKVLFSAKFGQGKTTFLHEYFKIKNDEFIPFYIYPVNYSIASNEDVFRYIKYELIYQLLNNNENKFDESNKSHSKNLKDFVGKNLHSLIAPLMLGIPAIGGSAFKMYKEYDKLKDEYLDYHEKENLGDVNKAQQFIDTFLLQEGSLYESNFYTFLIQKYINRLQEITKKEVVLVVDDIDRIDPEHVFRIFNVFSAHFEQRYYVEQTGNNKFGFDRVILVCDHKNIKSIFKHKYGVDTDYSGYLNKFYSTHIFEFENRATMLEMAQNMDSYSEHVYLSKTPSYKTLSFTIKLLIFSNLISLRDLIKLRKEMFQYSRQCVRNKGLAPRAIVYNPFIPVVHYLKRLNDTTYLKNIFARVKTLNLSEDMWQDIEGYEVTLLLLSVTGAGTNQYIDGKFHANLKYTENPNFDNEAYSDGITYYFNGTKADYKHNIERLRKVLIDGVVLYEKYYY